MVWPASKRTSRGSLAAATSSAGLEATWGVRVRNSYGCSEAGTLAASCGQGLHLNDDLVVVEPVDTLGERAIVDGAT
jgi:phenylacetate-coenzyme A ligase PaaK-like adenylate-forming protein